MDDTLESIGKAVLAASRAIDRGDLDEAARIVAETEATITAGTCPPLTPELRGNLGGVVIDLGTCLNDEPMAERGLDYTSQALNAQGENPSEAFLYNAGNGYSTLWSLRRPRAMQLGCLDPSHVQAKACYRRALDLSKSTLSVQSARKHNQLLVNYANCLDSVGRCVEAIEYYDQAIRRDNRMGEALGNKGIALSSLAFLAHGHTHLFLLEAQRLLNSALQQDLPPGMAQAFGRRREQVQSVIDGHTNKVKPERGVRTKAVSTFHKFLRTFCVQHGLYLTPTTFVDENSALVVGDPLFISEMRAPLDDNDKFDRYITFLDEIKEDYVLARYLLVQSQYRSDLAEAIDQDVSLYYPLNYSVHGAYVQMMKASLRMAMDVLDKIACFVRDYCGVSTPSLTKTSFSNLWHDKPTPLQLRPELASHSNRFLFALFDLSHDLSPGGAYHHLCERRNELTHRFLAVHDMLPSQKGGDYVPRVDVRRFLQECIQAMQVARAAVMYLVLFVDSEEKKAAETGLHGAIYGVPVDDTFRWIPGRGV